MLQPHEKPTVSSCSLCSTTFCTLPALGHYQGSTMVHRTREGRESNTITSSPTCTFSSPNLSSLLLTVWNQELKARHYLFARVTSAATSHLSQIPALTVWKRIRFRDNKCRRLGKVRYLAQSNIAKMASLSQPDLSLKLSDAGPDLAPYW